MLLLRVSICLLAVWGLMNNSLLAQAPNHLKYVPSSAFIAATAKPKAAMAEPVMALIPREVVEVFGQKELGLDLMALERVTVLVDRITDPQMRNPPEVGVIASFATAQSIGGNAAKFMEPTTVNGMNAFDLDGEAMLVMTDSRTMVFGTQKFVGKMLNADGASSGLIELLKSQPDSDQLSLHVTIEPLRAIMKDNLPPADELPPQFREFLRLPDLVRSVSYRGGFSSESANELICHAVDAPSAQEVANLAQQVFAVAKSLGLSWLAMESGIEDPDYQQAIMNYAERMAHFIESNVGPKIEGEQVVFSLGGVGGYAGLATLGMVFGISTPEVEWDKAVATQSDSREKLREIMIAAHNYHDAYGHFPANSYDDNGKPLLSWRVKLLPFLEENALSQQFQMEEPWDSPHNKRLLEQMPACFRHPNRDLGNRTVFLGVSGKGTAFEAGRKIRIRNFRDGTSNTAAIVETDESEAQFWTQPADWNYDNQKPLRGLGGDNPIGFHVVFADASVQLIPKPISPDFWKAICTLNGGEIIDRTQFDR